MNTTSGHTRGHMDSKHGKSLKLKLAACMLVMAALNTASAQTRRCLWKSHDYLGMYDLEGKSSFSASSAYSCIELCRERKRCNAVSFNRGRYMGSNCWLKNVPRGRSPMRHATREEYDVYLVNAACSSALLRQSPPKRVKRYAKQAMNKGTNKVMKRVTKRVSTFAGDSPNMQTLFSSGDRIAITADGNLRDEDDIFAMPLSLALLDAGGYKNKLVFFGYNNHIWDQHRGQGNKSFKYNGKTMSQSDTMQSVVMEAKQMFGYTNTFVDESAAYRSCNGCFGSANRATTAFAAAVRASSANSKLWIIGAGPMQTVYEYLKFTVGNNGAGTSNQLAHVILLSHSYHNNEHATTYHAVESVVINGKSMEVPEVSWGEVKMLMKNHGGSIHYGGRVCVDNCGTSGSMLPVDNTSLGDQNKGLDFEGKAKGFSVYDFLDNGNPKMEFVYRSMMLSRVADPSDAGIMYYLLSRDPNATPSKIQKYLARSSSYQ